MDSILNNPTVLRAAHLISFPTAFLLAGYSISFSQNSVPQIYDVRPQISTPIFKRIFLDGARPVVPLALLSLSASGFAAYAVPEKRVLWITAATTMAMTGLWTSVVMMPGIKRLMDISEGGDKVQGKVEQTLEHRQLMIRWVKQNWIRAAMFFASGVTGLLATV